MSISYQQAAWTNHSEFLPESLVRLVNQIVSQTVNEISSPRQPVADDYFR